MPFRWRHTLYAIRHVSKLRDHSAFTFDTPQGYYSLDFMNRYGCIFVHVTKTAGTAVGRSLFCGLPTHLTAIQYRWMLGRERFNAMFKFAFVRNPWDRLLSAYAYLKGGGWGPVDEEWVHANLDSVDSFNDFVLSWLNDDRLNLHMHLWPQHWFTNDVRDRCLLDYVGRFESLDRDFAVLRRKLGIEADLPRMNSSRHKDYRDVYTPEAVDRVAELYSRDIDQFGYTFLGGSR